MSIPAIVFVSLKPREGASQSFLDAMGPMIKSTRNESGNEIYDLYGDETGEFHLFERYVDEEALRTHRASDHFRTFQADIVDLLVGERIVKPLIERDVAN